MIEHINVFVPDRASDRRVRNAETLATLITADFYHFESLGFVNANTGPNPTGR